MNKDPLARHYEDVVSKTWNYNNRCETEKDHLVNAVMGLAAEAAEVLDEHKKLFFHAPKDRTKAIFLECGDVCYYLAKLLNIYGWALEEVLEANKVKLFERYEVKQ